MRVAETGRGVGQRKEVKMMWNACEERGVGVEYCLKYTEHVY